MKVTSIFASEKFKINLIELLANEEYSIKSVDEIRTSGFTNANGVVVTGKLSISSGVKRVYIPHGGSLADAASSIELDGSETVLTIKADGEETIFINAPYQLSRQKVTLVKDEKFTLKPDTFLIVPFSDALSIGTKDLTKFFYKIANEAIVKADLDTTFYILEDTNAIG